MHQSQERLQLAREIAKYADLDPIVTPTVGEPQNPDKNPRIWRTVNNNGDDRGVNHARGRREALRIDMIRCTELKTASYAAESKWTLPR